MSNGGNPSVQLDFLRRKLAATEALLERQTILVDSIGSGPGPPEPEMNERLAKLEGIVDGLRSMQTVTLSVLALTVTLVIAFGVYGQKRVDDLSDKISGLPGQISKDLRDLTNTLSSAITASKQQPPQVILMPISPQPQPPEPKNP